MSGDSKGLRHSPPQPQCINDSSKVKNGEVEDLRTHTYASHVSSLLMAGSWICHESQRLPRVSLWRTLRLRIRVDRTASVKVNRTWVPRWISRLYETSLNVLAKKFQLI
ncbi:hypothetical protein TWF225_009017 [Orbilia oligospora]|uniref:Uncharacterized protein n=1 Tax=Orbilia oligospora TaxID=2813651 RepID=A0A7C8PH19_ORBOL|nr:hypothetical protein TWF751_006227 [Orbilia oligospora]KAF3175119.1 hypothetical protein TWF225_009017 [Orbilia oligospora]KAF3234567.1 hypothetical protein TWF128_002302 [Orbilia oligospora]KAF3248678.1 hypothetical protein TWF217_009037 [Orbilia oligospora]KAF3281741.1 hypothetical protein TWF132_011156 [Orbilia oligospora]